MKNKFQVEIFDGYPHEPDSGYGGLAVKISTGWNQFPASAQCAKRKPDFFSNKKLSNLRSQMIIFCKNCALFIKCQLNN